ncbi:MAG: hypothetical protein Q7J45_00740 [bacterium]|nr:hypothetical protein [bacterium]
MSSASILAEQAVLDAIDQQRLAAGMTVEAGQLLSDLRDDLLGILAVIAVTSTSTRRLEKRATEAITKAYKDLEAITDMAAIAEVFESKCISDLEDAFPDAEITAPEEDDPADVMGHPVGAWWARQAENLAFGFIGLGGAAFALSGPRLVVLMNTQANHAKSLIYTATTAAGGDARMRVYSENEKVLSGDVGGFKQISVLDSRTSDVCRTYSGATWDLQLRPTGVKKLDFDGGCPRHDNCRSVIVPTPGTGVDENLNEETSFLAWIGSKSAAEQDAILGAGRLDQYRAGTITLTQLLDARANPISLEALRSKYA